MTMRERGAEKSWEGEKSSQETAASLGGSIPDDVSVVYFVAAPGRVKVGFTKQFPRRFNNLNWSDAGHLTIIGWIYGDRRTERAIHDALAGFRLENEWFKDCEAVRAVLKAAASGEMDLPTGFDLRVVNPHVIWASEMLKRIAGPRPVDEKRKDTIGRVSDRLGFSYWRTFDLWYRKAHRLEIDERNAINSVMEPGR
jgi:hypothetical protein